MGKVVDLARYAAEQLAARDVELNEKWDHLLVLVDEAWCKRDPESLSEVLIVLNDLRAEAKRDWGY